MSKLCRSLPVCLWLCVFPLYQYGTYSSITHDKWQGMLILTGVTVLLTAADMLLRRREEKFRLNTGVILLLVFAGWMLFSALRSPFANLQGLQDLAPVWIGAKRYEGMVTQGCYCLIGLCLMRCRDVPAKVLSAAACVSLLLICITAALQYAGINVLGLYPKGRSVRTNYEFQSTIGNIDMNSGFLCLVIPLLLVRFVCGGSPLLLIPAGAGALFAAMIEVQSGTLVTALLVLTLVCAALARGGHRVRSLLAAALLCLMYGLRRCVMLPWLDGGDSVTLCLPGRIGQLLLAAALVLTALALLQRYGRPPGMKGGWAAAVCLVLVAAMIAAAAVLPIPQEAGGLWQIHEVLQGRLQDDFGSERVGVWRQTLLMCLDRTWTGLLTGTGPDTFYYALPDWQQVNNEHLRQRFDAPHNEYIALLSNGGAVALAVYLLLLALAVIRCVRRRSWPLLAAVTGFALQAFFSFSVCIVNPVFWAVLGMALQNAEKKQYRAAPITD